MESSTKSPVIILASGSVNRLNIMRQMNIEPIVMVSDFEENLPVTLPAKEFVEQTALGKLETILWKLKQENNKDFDAVIACDTMIVIDGNLVGKPADAADAIKTLKRLRGREHTVYTGVAIGYPDGSQTLFHEETVIKFGEYSDQLIEKYVATGSPLNKAGSCGTSDFGGVFIESYKGCYSNIGGLPIYRVYSHLVNKGIV